MPFVTGIAFIKFLFLTVRNKKNQNEHPAFAIKNQNK
jgi:hypothetical protein